MQIPDAGGAQSFTIPRSIKAQRGAIDEDLYARPLPEEIPDLYHNRVTDEEFEIFSSLDGGMRLGVRESYDEFSTRLSEVGHEARYFDDEDLFRRLDNEDDYPQGVEEDDDARDAFEERVLFGNEDAWVDERWSVIEEEVPHVHILHEGAITNARYFDVNDLYDRGYSAYGEEETGLEQEEFEDGLEDFLPGRKRWSGLSTTGDELSPLQGNHDRWRIVPPHPST